MTKEIYHIERLTHAYRRHPVLRIDELNIRAASIIGIIGPNGSGKSTLLKLLAFIEKPSSGRIQFKGVSAEPFDVTVRFQVTLLTQEPYLMKRSVFSNVAYGLRLRGNGADVKQRVMEALSWVGLEEEAFAQRRWNELSGGEAQRVALAARLVLRPEVLLLDEPTASVDAQSAQLIKDAVARAKKKWGTTLVIASHDWPWLYEICDEVRHMFRGRFFGTGEKNILFGPWQPVPGSAYWGRRLSDGQTAEVPEPPGPDAVAIIPSAAIAFLTDGTAAHNACRLTGTVSRLIHEHRSGEIVATVLVGSVPFTAKVTREAFRRYDLYPGREVCIAYEPDAITWSH